MIALSILNLVKSNVSLTIQLYLYKSHAITDLFIFTLSLVVYPTCLRTFDLFGRESGLVHANYQGQHS